MLTIGMVSKAIPTIRYLRNTKSDTRANGMADTILKKKPREHISLRKAVCLTRNENVGRCIIYQQVFLRTEAIKDTKHESV